MNFPVQQLVPGCQEHDKYLQPQDRLPVKNNKFTYPLITATYLPADHPRILKKKIKLTFSIYSIHSFTNTGTRLYSLPDKDSKVSHGITTPIRFTCSGTAFATTRRGDREGNQAKRLKPFSPETKVRKLSCLILRDTKNLTTTEAKESLSSSKEIPKSQKLNDKTNQWFLCSNEVGAMYATRYHFADCEEQNMVHPVSNLAPEVHFHQRNHRFSWSN